jgi:CHAT domain-containing protein/cytochrome c-type biogenesis protein CcmH/NrfG
MELLSHASECDACGALVADLRKEAPAEAGTPGAAPEAWRQAMATRMAKAARVRSMPRPKRPFANPWLRLAAGVALMAIAAGGWWIYRMRSVAPVFTALAQSYSENRPFEFRLSGAAYGPLRVTRGRNAPPPVELLEAQARIARHLLMNPADPAWLRAEARADLLEGEYATAIEELRHAQETAGSAPELLGDLAIAYLQRASAERHAPDIAAAIDLLSEALNRDPQNPVYRFNRALAREELPAPHEAADDWREFLRREPSGGWADEAREHLRRVEELIQKQRTGAEGNGDDLEPGAVLATLEKGPAAEIAALARTMKTRHGDAWAEDLAAEARRASFVPTRDALLRADQAAVRGEADEARALALNAARTLPADSAAAVLAGYQIAHSYERGSHPEECERAARQSLGVAHRKGYRWLEAQLDFTLAACLSMERRVVEADEATTDAERAASEAGYTAAVLRGAIRHATLYSYVGAYRDVLRLCHDALLTYWQGSYPLVAAYECYHDMAEATRGLGLPGVTATLSREAEEIAGIWPNRAVEGMIRSIHAEDLAKAGRPMEGDREFTQAERILSSLKPMPSKDLYLAYAALGRAEIAAQQNRAGDGLKRIEPLGTELTRIHNKRVEIRYARLKGELLLERGDAEAAAACFRQALAAYAPPDPEVARNGDGSSLTSEASSALAALVELLLSRGEQTGAIRTWEDYYPSFRSAGRPDESAVRIVFANLPHGLVVWIDGGRDTKLARIPVGVSNLQLLVANLRREASDPHSSLERIRRLGAKLYGDLFKGIEPSIRNANTLWISLDPVLQEVPISVLVDSEGRWLGDRFRICYSLQTLAGSTSPHPSQIDGGLRLLAVGAGGSARLFDHNLPALPEAESEVRDAAGAFPDATLLLGDSVSAAAVEKKLPEAGVFHFSGHAIVSAVDAGLVLPNRGNGDVLWASYLSADKLRGCRLAVLSACSTAKMADDADSSSVMASAFLAAGVPQVIAARWDVDSRAAGVFMRSFYRGLASGLPVGHSLSAAAGQLRSDPRMAHPYYWAAFDLFRK